MQTLNQINSLGATVEVIDESKLSNALVRQKNAIIKKLYDAEGADEIGQVVDLIEFVRPVWQELGYEYKAKELLSRIVNECHANFGEVNDMLASLRKNAKDRGSWQTEANKLNELVTRVCILRS